MRTCFLKMGAFICILGVMILSLSACAADSDPESLLSSNAQGTSATADTTADTSASAGTAGESSGNADTDNTTAGTSQKTDADKNTSGQAVSTKTKQTTKASKTTTKKDTFKGTTYYVSSSKGDDWNEGTSESEPLQSLAVAGTVAEAGDRVLFKRGDVWRGESMNTRSGVTYGAYGSGADPAIYGSSQNYSVQGKWKVTSNARIYCFDQAISRDVGGVIFNNGSAFGTRQESRNNLSSDKDYFYNPTDKKVYLYSRKGNPADVWSSIEFNERINLISLKGNDVTIQNLTFRYADYGIVGGGNKNITIKNCDFAWIGGCLHNYSDKTRYGNAVEIYGGINGLTVSDCTFSQIFDTAITAQYVGSSDTTIQNVTISDNKVDKCQWSMEFWLECKNSSGKYIGTIKNIKILNNQFSNAGKGWSASQRWGGGSVSSCAHFMTMSATGYAVSDILFKNNTFKGSANNLLGIYWDNYTPAFEGNTYIQTENKPFAVMGNSRLTFDASVAEKIKAFDKSATVQFLK